MYFLSIDVANKSLAISFLQYNKNIEFKKINIINKLITLQELIDLNRYLNNIINYYICEVIDLLPNKKVKNSNIIERSNALKQYISNLKYRLDNLINKYNISKILLLIENQPSFNDKSRTTFNQIIYAFSKNNLYDIKVMNPMYKNMVYFKKDLHHSNFIKKYANNYLANKNHTKANFLYFLEKYNMKDKIHTIKKKNYDDIADSFMQIFAYIQILHKKEII
jgi:hypothetical protein